MSRLSTRLLSLVGLRVINHSTALQSVLSRERVDSIGYSYRTVLARETAGVFLVVKFVLVGSACVP